MGHLRARGAVGAVHSEVMPAVLVLELQEIAADLKRRHVETVARPLAAIDAVTPAVAIAVEADEAHPGELPEAAAGLA